MNRWKLHAFADEASSMIDGQIAAMKRNGLDGLEIRSVDGQSVSNISSAKAAEVRKKMDDAGLVVWAIGSPLGKIRIDEPFEPHVEMLKRTLEISSMLGTKRIRIFSFYIPRGENPESFRSAVMERMNTMLDIADSAGMMLCHENEKGIYGDVAIRCKELLDGLPRLHGIFDPANFIQVGQNTWSAWQMLKDRIDYLHMKDALEDGNVVPAGYGIGRVADIMNSYFADGGRYVTIEPHLKVFDGLSSLERKGEALLVGTHIYHTNDEAFDAGCAAVKALIEKRES